MQMMPRFIIARNVAWKSKLIRPHLHAGESVLDFGCGDLSLARELKHQIRHLSITGIDVVGTSSTIRGIQRVKYDGTILPFKNNSVDVVLAFHVFHHCQNPDASYRECLRVAQKRLIFVEPLARYDLERYGMGLMDWLYNSWKSEKVPFTYQYKTMQQWDHCIRKTGCSHYTAHEVMSFTSFLPFGIAVIFDVSKKIQ